MKKLTFLFACLICMASAANAAVWMTDLPSALPRAIGENKLVLINFTGSDWCPACIKIKNQVFASPQFKSYADNNLILVEIDFPRRKAQSAAQKRANEALQEKFGINAYPTMLLLNGNGAKVAMVEAYNSPEGFVPHLKEMVEANSPLGARKSKEGEPSAELPPWGGAPTSPPPTYSALTLKSIGGPKDRRMAMINNKTFAVGETAMVKMGEGQVKVRCLEIGDQSVVITIDGREERRELKLRGNL